jgi:hypothetical protein
MNSFLRWIVIIVFTMTLAFPALAQNSGFMPGLDKALPNVSIRHVDRIVLGGDIVHYRFDVKVGPGKFDVIRLHRIVRERRPYQPVPTIDGVLLLPGSPNTFEMIFMEPLISQVPNWDQSITVFLAKNNLDVWGMDYRWALVPAEQKNFQFMKEWGLERDVQDTQIALSLARTIRLMTGQGIGRLHLLGFSYGVYLTYAVASQETQQPWYLRNVKAIIPVDWAMKYPVGSSERTSACDSLPQLQASFAAGVYDDNTGAILKEFGDLARSAPNDPSPFADGFTNYQFALFVGASPSPPPPLWHFVGGYFDDAGITTGLRFTDSWLWVDVLRAVPPYVPMHVDIDANTVICYDVVPPFDDHLSEITLPILYVGARGGTGQDGYYATTLTASQDITKFTVQLLSDDQQAFDFGHADQFTAKHADKLVWKPILDWIVAHR